MLSFLQPNFIKPIDKLNVRSKGDFGTISGLNNVSLDLSRISSFQISFTSTQKDSDGNFSYYDIYLPTNNNYEKSPIYVPTFDVEYIMAKIIFLDKENKKIKFNYDFNESNFANVSGKFYLEGFIDIGASTLLATNILGRNNTSLSNKNGLIVGNDNISCGNDGVVEGSQNINLISRGHIEGIRNIAGYEVGIEYVDFNNKAITFSYRDSNLNKYNLDIFLLKFQHKNRGDIEFAIASCAEINFNEEFNEILLNYMPVTSTTGVVIDYDNYQLQSIIVRDGFHSHIEGEGNTMIGGDSNHEEGKNNFLAGDNSHVEGIQNISISNKSHIEGWNNITGYAYNVSAFDLVNNNIVIREKIDKVTFKIGRKIWICRTLRYDPALSPAEEIQAYYFNDILETKISRIDFDNNTIEPADSFRNTDTAQTFNVYKITHIIVDTKFSEINHVEGYENRGFSQGPSHVEGIGNITTGDGAHSEGARLDSQERGSLASGYGSHAEGNGSTASGEGAHSEGRNTEASGDYSHAEGRDNQATNEAAHAEGGNNFNFGRMAHVEGGQNVISYIRHVTSVDFNTKKIILESTPSAQQLEAEDILIIGALKTSSSGSDSYEKVLYTTKIVSTDVDLKTITVQSLFTVPSDAEGIIYNVAYPNINTELDYAHAEGTGNIVNAEYSHVEGFWNRAWARGSHAEGAKFSNQKYGSLASGYGSHAEGNGSVASGQGAHAEGVSTASGAQSHSEGYGTKATNKYAHAEGQSTTAGGLASHAQNYGSMAYGNYSSAGGYQCLADGHSSFASGYKSQAVGFGCHAFGHSSLAFSQKFGAKVNTINTTNKTLALTKSIQVVVDEEVILFNDHGVRLGWFKVSAVSSDGRTLTLVEAPPTQTAFAINHTKVLTTVDTANDSPSMAAGDNCIAYNGSIAMGDWCIAAGLSSAAIGFANQANGSYSFAVGSGNTANEGFSFAAGNGTTARALYQTVIGSYNVANASTATKFIIGKGINSYNKANCFRVTNTGTYATGSYNASGADYAEMFEWATIPEVEELRGRFVTLDGDKIRLAKPNEDFILGITSGNPSIIGDVYDDQWQGMYLRDIFGSPILNEEGLEVLNPDYDPEETYIPRGQREEWAVVGLMGKLVTIDDGSCVPNGWATVGLKGAATESLERTKYRVMKRIDENHIQILILP